MRIVIDTNVIVSGLLSPHGAPARIVEGMLSDTFVVLYDDRIFTEYSEVLSRPALGIESSELDIILDYLLRDGEHVSTRPTDLVLPDPTDLPFLEVAMDGHADVLITGNARHFRPTRGEHSVNISSPADFLRRLA